ncbi:hypothetical protein LCGC14_0562890 [marine sediment metagenome]|uniref:Uncharacterized protein n=1 Tax=marine sediment metagenome TaxID=412755 RepID=A0A0F9UUS5_9ZZZZ
MAPRKKAKNGKGPPVDSDGNFVLPEILLLKLRAADAECRMSLAELEVASNRVAKAIEAVPAVNKAMLDQNLAMGRISVRKGERSKVYKEIEELFGVDQLSLYTIDEKTGIMELKPVDKSTGEEAPTKGDKPSA